MLGKEIVMFGHDYDADVSQTFEQYDPQESFLGITEYVIGVACSRSKNCPLLCPFHVCVEPSVSRSGVTIKLDYVLPARSAQVVNQSGLL